MFQTNPCNISHIYLLRYLEVVLDPSHGVTDADDDNSLIALTNWSLETGKLSSISGVRRDF